jgi:hypothetical protein
MIYDSKRFPKWATFKSRMRRYNARCAVRGPTLREPPAGGDPTDHAT